MKQIDLIIQNRTGLHARPARVLVDTAKQFTSAVRLRHGAKAANAKSLISVLALGVTSGGAVVLEVDGADEDLAADTLCAAVADGLGEGAHAPATGAAAPAPAAPAPPPAAGELRGVAAAPGIAIGPTFRLRRAAVQVHDYSSGATLEGERLRRALADAAGQLVALREQVLQRAGPEEAAIFDVHHELIADAELHAAVFARIDAGQSAAAAWHAATIAAADVMAALPDPTLAGRAADLRDAGERVLRLLSGDAAPSAELPPEPVILLAYDLSPSETAALDPQRVLGFCTAVGGPNAHAAILARALGLPAIVSAGPAILDLEDGTPAILDGATGALLTRPGRNAMDEARDRQRRATDARRAALESAATPAVTTDGHRVEVAANIGSADDARRAVESGAEAVGLLRSEFLFLEREQAPSEAEQRAVYAEILAAMGGRPVVLRTLDIGGDKPLPYLSLPAEENPFLGERGIRLCQAHPHLLEQQLRAALGARPRRAGRARRPGRDHGRGALRRADGRRPGRRVRLLQRRDERPDPVHHGDRPHPPHPGRPRRWPAPRRAAPDRPHREGRPRRRPLGGRLRRAGGRPGRRADPDRAGGGRAERQRAGHPVGQGPGPRPEHGAVQGARPRRPGLRHGRRGARFVRRLKPRPLLYEARLRGLS
ncbi:HPr family phosphocarrier protein [Oscillochloris sp. ZM17-4]|nr:HPr family phosphocarrier protein [Oscillochloris sp. ZM17-4]